MTITNDTYVPKVGPNAPMRIEVDNGPRESDDDFWNRLDKMIQIQFEQLAREVHRIRPDAQSKGIFAPARFIPLCSYREFRVGDNDIQESIIVGVSYRNNLGKFVLEGDICSEDAGTTYYEAGLYEIPPQQRDEIERVAMQLAVDLSKRAKDVVANLPNAS